MNIKKLITTAAFLLLSSASYGQAETVVIQNGWITGNEFLDWQEAQKSSYLMGLFDGIFISPFFDASQEKLQLLENCTADMTNIQLVAILDLYLSRNPAEWHNDMHVIFYRSFAVETCGLSF